MLTYLLLTSGTLDALIEGPPITGLAGIALFIGCIIADLKIIGFIGWHLGEKQKARRRTDELDNRVDELMADFPDPGPNSPLTGEYLKRQNAAFKIAKREMGL